MRLRLCINPASKATHAIGFVFIIASCMSYSLSYAMIFCQVKIAIETAEPLWSGEIVLMNVVLWVFILTGLVWMGVIAFVADMAWKAGIRGWNELIDKLGQRCKEAKLGV